MSYTGGKAGAAQRSLWNWAKLKSNPAGLWLNFPPGQLRAERDLESLQYVKTHKEIEGLLPNILERVLEEPAHPGSAPADTDTEGTLQRQDGTPPSVYKFL